MKLPAKKNRAVDLFTLICALASVCMLQFSYLRNKSSPHHNLILNPSRRPAMQEVSGAFTPEEATRLDLEPKAWSGIVVHHTVVTASPENISLSHFGRGFRGLAYHFLIVDSDPVSHKNVFISRRWLSQDAVPHTSSKDVNRNTIAIAVVGNFQEGPPSRAQLESLRRLLGQLSERFGIGAPAMRPHSYYTKTLCPGSYLSQWLKAERRNYGRRRRRTKLVAKRHLDRNVERSVD